MKLVMVTSVEDFHNEILQLFNQAGIQNFSESGIQGYKNAPSLLSSSNWFAANKSATNSIMIFSFTQTEKIDKLFSLLEEFNQNLETNNPVKAIVLPIERHL